MFYLLWKDLKLKEILHSKTQLDGNQIAEVKEMDELTKPATIMDVATTTALNEAGIPTAEQVDEIFKSVSEILDDKTNHSADDAEDAIVVEDSREVKSLKLRIGTKCVGHEKGLGELERTVLLLLLDDRFREDVEDETFQDLCSFVTDLHIFRKNLLSIFDLL